MTTLSSFNFDGNKFHPDGINVTIWGDLIHRVVSSAMIAA